MASSILIQNAQTLAHLSLLDTRALSEKAFAASALLCHRIILFLFVFPSSFKVFSELALADPQLLAHHALAIVEVSLAALATGGQVLAFEVVLHVVVGHAVAVSQFLADFGVPAVFWFSVAAIASGGGVFCFVLGEGAGRDVLRGRSDAHGV